MPTAYTDKVLRGEATNAQEFAQVCAHAFVWSMRDRPIGEGIMLPPRNDDYAARRLEEVLSDLKEWDESTEEEKYVKWSDYADGLEESKRRVRTEKLENLKSLQTVLSDVERIIVPEELSNFKKFMVEQLRETIAYDGTFRPEYYKVMDYSTWAGRQRSDILQDLQFAIKDLAKSEERYQKSLQWVSILAQTYGVEVEGL